MERLEASFRDPAGYVARKEGRLVRVIAPEGMENWRLFLRSGLAERLVRDGLLVPFASAGAENMIYLREIPFLTYPYEWSFGALRDAALLTLDVNLTALEHGMVLQDASAFNVAFEGGKPLFLDHGSFVAYREGEPWRAYRQFVMHFLAPLLLMRYTDVRCLDFFRAHLEGFPLDFTSRLLPLKTRWMLHPLIHIHLHSRMERRVSGAAGSERQAHVSASRLTGFLGELRRYIASLRPPRRKTAWQDYYCESNYTDRSFAFKQAEVERFCRACAPRVAVDLGANTGVYSVIAARYAETVVAADMDPAAAEQLYELARGKVPNLVPMLLDLNNPSPGLGLFGAERTDFFRRCRGDLVLGLALIHHLHISGNWPLDHIARLFADMARHAALVEFVPHGDSQVRQLMRGRPGQAEDWTLEAVTASFSRRFASCRKIPIPGSERVLLELHHETMKRRMAE